MISAATYVCQTQWCVQTCPDIITDLFLNQPWQRIRHVEKKNMDGSPNSQVIFLSGVQRDWPWRWRSSRGPTWIPAHTVPTMNRRHKVSVCLLQGSQSSFCLRSAKVAWTKKSEASGNKRNKPDASEQNQLPAPATWLLYFPGFCDQWLKSPTHGLTKVWFRNLPKFSLPLLT